MGKVVTIEDVMLALLEKGQSSKRYKLGEFWELNGEEIREALSTVPAAEPEIIRCKDCRWWDKYDETFGYCHAIKHKHWSEHWEISIQRTYNGNFYCADAERKVQNGC